MSHKIPYSLDKIDRFWSRFAERSEKYFDVTDNRGPHLRKLRRALRNIDQNLNMAFGPIREDDTREIIISVQHAYDPLEAARMLVMNFPELPKCKISALRRSNVSIASTCYENTTLRTDDVFFLYTDNDNKLRLEIFIRGYDPSKKWRKIVLNLMHCLIGSADTEAFVELHKIHPLQASESTPLSISVLPNVVETIKLKGNK